MKRRVGIFFGGRSEEFEVSITSTKTLLQEIDRNLYQVVLVGIDKRGYWHLTDEELELRNPKPFYDVCKQVLPLVDVVFPLIHGPYGEDGALQGLLRVADIPFVGPDVLGSSIGMDKDVTKRLLREAGLPVVPFQVLHERDPLQKCNLEFPVIVKPANMGSSLGIAKAHNWTEFKARVKDAFCFDTKVVIEKLIDNVREFECSVMGLDQPRVSLPGELVAKGGFYDYHNKYEDPQGAKFILPAPLDTDEMHQIQKLSLKAYEVLCSEIMIRVDFLRAPSGKLYLSEINTIPGFTPISLFPKLWEFSNISYSEVVTKLIELAIERASKKQNLSIRL